MCKPSEAGDSHAFIRDTIAHELGPDVATATTILYGGSVSGPNVAEYLAETDIDGGLVGTASQELAPFRLLVDATIAVYQSQVDGY